jgi:hypothetical protein
MRGKLKKCPSCGNFFTCQGEDDCWCEKYQIPNKEFLRLSQDYNDCICPECLKKYAE